MATMDERMGEERAAQAALTGTRWERAAVGAGALRQLLRDPDDTAQVFALGLALNGERFPQFLARFAATDGGARLLREQPSIDSSSVDFNAMRSLPASTLGGAYVRYLDQHKLDPDLFQTPPGLPEIPGFLARRLRQTHDIWHTLTGYTPDVPGEVALQGFTFAQTGMPSAFLIALLGTLRWGLSAHDLPRRTLDAYERGQQAAFLAPVLWEEQWGDDLDVVRARHQIRPAAV